MHRDDLKLFLCGDVMTGRGVDQVLPFHCDPTLHESFVRDARDYVLLAEEAHGPVPRPVGLAQLWGDAAAELGRVRPHVRLVNLETSVTTSDDWWPGKGIHYRMHPGNAPALAAVGIRCCALANNHVLDWGRAGLLETLDALRGAGLQVAGAGRTLDEARAPAVLPGPRGRVLVLGLGSTTSGIPEEWAATAARAGVRLLPDLSVASAEEVAAQVRALRRPGDVVVASIHWGPNWEYAVDEPQRAFAHRLVEAGGADVVHGHSSHHVKGVEVHRGRLVLYGCGDLLTDYEGISGYEAYRGDLGLLYFATLDADGGLRALEMTPVRQRRLRLERAPAADAAWLAALLEREGRPFGTGARLRADGRLELRRA